jgi:hypothetical protein
MADVKISALPLATTPLAGTEVLPIVQSATTDQVSVANLTAGRAVSAASLTLTTTPLAVGSGGTGLSTLTAGYIPYGNGTSAFNSSSNFTYDGSANVTNYSNVNAQSWIAVRNNNAGSSASTGILFGNDGNAAYGAAYINSSTNTGIGAANGLNVGTYGSFPLTFFTSATGRMTLDASGNLGIGTSSPVAKLQVNSSSAVLGYFIGNNSNNYIQMSDTNGTNTCSFGSISGGNSYTYTLGYHAIYTGGGERVRIDSSGNLLVGTTSSPSGTKKLRVADSILDDLAVGSGAHFDTSNATPITLTQSSNALLISGSAYYLVLITERNLTGNTALFLLGNGGVVLINQTGGAWTTGTTPSTVQMSIGFSGGNYRVYNGLTTVGTYLYSATIIRCF